MDPHDDFPAAHSMDSGWFAVDRDGHVAYFESGEAGAVPNDASLEESTGMLSRLEAAVPRTEPVYDLTTRSGIHDKGPQHETPAVDGGPPVINEEPWCVVVFLASLDAVAEELWGGLAIPVPSRGPTAVFFPDLPIDSYRRLHDSGACLACFRNDPKYSDLPERLGLYHYNHPDALYIPEPYGRWGSPQQPLRIDGLPAALAEAIGRVRFEGLCFEETGRLQPIEHVPSVCWDSGGYLSVDGQSIRPVPGQEEQFGSEEERMAEELGIRAERPPR